MSKRKLRINVGKKKNLRLKLELSLLLQWVDAIPHPMLDTQAVFKTQ